MKNTILLTATLILSFACMSHGQAGNRNLEAQKNEPPSQKFPITPIYAIIMGSAYLGFADRKRRMIQEEIERATHLKKQLAEHTKWDKTQSNYGTFFIRKGIEKYPDPEDKNGRIESPHTIVALTNIQDFFIEFTDGSMFGSNHIKRVENSWHFSNHDTDGAVEVHMIVRLHFSDIDFFNWEVNDYWEWPQIFCKFTDQRKFPSSQIYFAEKVSLGDEVFYKRICNHKEVATFPKELS